MAAAGMPDGSYQLGSQRVTVAGGVARLLEDPGRPGPGRDAAIAGSTATLADVVRHAIAAGLPVPDVAAAASTTPARVLGLPTVPARCARAWPRTWSSATTTSAPARSCATASG